MDGQERELTALDELFCQLVAEGHSPERALREAGFHEEIAADYGAESWARPDVRRRVAELRAEALPKRVALVTGLMDRMKLIAEQAFAAGDVKSAREALQLLEETRSSLEIEMRNGGRLNPPPSLEVMTARFAAIMAEFATDGLIDEPPFPIGTPANANPSANPGRRAKPPPRPMPKPSPKASAKRRRPKRPRQS